MGCVSESLPVFSIRKSLPFVATPPKTAPHLGRTPGGLEAPEAFGQVSLGPDEPGARTPVFLQIMTPQTGCAPGEETRD